MASYTNGFQPNATAGPSDATRYANPQLGPDPWFTYPTPAPEELDNELPPYEYAFENEDVGLSDILHRLTVKGHEDLAKLATETYVRGLSSCSGLITDYPPLLCSIARGISSILPSINGNRF
jgi:mediator of RNA polymerase II transcription subunit 14